MDDDKFTVTVTFRRIMTGDELLITARNHNVPDAVVDLICREYSDSSDGICMYGLSEDELAIEQARRSHCVTSVGTHGRVHCGNQGNFILEEIESALGDVECAKCRSKEIFDLFFEK